MFFQTTPLSTHLKKEEKKEKMPSDLKIWRKKNTNGQKSTKQNLIDRHTLLLSVTEYIIYALQCQFRELFPPEVSWFSPEVAKKKFVKLHAVTLCVYVCLFVRISVDTTVIIKNMSLPIQTTTNLWISKSSKKWKPQLAIRVFVKKRTKKNLLPYYEHKIKTACITMIPTQF